MDLSVFLAELLGLYMLIMAAELLFRRKELAGAVERYCLLQRGDHLLRIVFSSIRPCNRSCPSGL